MSTPNEPQDPDAGRKPEEPAPPGGAPQMPAAPPYPSAPAYGYTPPQPSGYPAAPQYGAPGAAYGYPAAPQYGAVPGYAGGNAFAKNSLAVWSLVLAIVGMVLCGLLTGIPAVIIGSRAKRAVAAGEANNGGLATAGIVVGWIAIALSVIGAIAVGFLIANAGGWAEYINENSTRSGY